MEEDPLLKNFISRLVPVDEDLSDPAEYGCAVDTSRIQPLRPQRQVTDASILEQVYELIPFRLPQLYEKLFLSYIWPDSEFKNTTVFGREPQGGWHSLINKFKRDEYLYAACVNNGFLPFGKGADIDYDPLCFDYNNTKISKPRIVMLDHEAALCYDKARVHKQIAKDFREFIT